MLLFMKRHDVSLERFIAGHREASRPVPKEQVFSILRQLVDALAQLHDPAKLGADDALLPVAVRRGLEPAGILIREPDKHVAIADAGLCRGALSGGACSAYTAPETLLEGKATPASDVWALGVIIYELATLQTPDFLGGRNPGDVFVDGWRPDLSAIEDAFVKMVLEKIFVLDPIERPTAGELVDRLRTLSTSASKLATQDPVSGEGRRSYIISDSSSSKISFSWTPFVRAITDGDIKAVKRHLSKKGGKNARGDLALMVAANVGHRDVVELLDPTDKSGATALMRAAERGNVIWRGR